MKQCLFLILLMTTPSLALANNTNATTHSDLGKAAPMHASAEPVIMVRQHDRATTAKRKLASASVKTQPMVIKLKPHKYAAVRRTKNKPTMAMRPIYPPRRVVANVPVTSPRKSKIVSTSGKYTKNKRTPSGKGSKQSSRTKLNTNKTGKTKIARADS